MTWVRYTNDTEPRDYPVDLSAGWILNEDVKEYKKGTVLTKEITISMKSNGIKDIPVRFKNIAIGDQVRFPMQEHEIFVIIDITGKGKSRICLIERLGKKVEHHSGPFKMSIPEFDVNNKFKKKVTKGDLALWQVWIDDEKSEESELGYEPEEENEEVVEEDDNYWTL